MLTYKMMKNVNQRCWLLGNSQLAKKCHHSNELDAQLNQVSQAYWGWQGSGGEGAGISGQLPYPSLHPLHLACGQMLLGYSPDSWTQGNLAD